MFQLWDNFFQCTPLQTSLEETPNDKNTSFTVCFKQSHLQMNKVFPTSQNIDVQICLITHSLKKEVCKLKYDKSQKLLLTLADMLPCPQLSSCHCESIKTSKSSLTTSTRKHLLKPGTEEGQKNFGGLSSNKRTLRKELLLPLLPTHRRFTKSPWFPSPPALKTIDHSP